MASFPESQRSISYLVGCGAGSGCANVLGSRWSQEFLIPVSLLSLLLYGWVLWLTFRSNQTALPAAMASAWFAPPSSISAGNPVPAPSPQCPACSPD